jgi:hypothetical protein
MNNELTTDALRRPEQGLIYQAASKDLAYAIPFQKDHTSLYPMAQTCTFLSKIPYFSGFQKGLKCT